MTLFSKSVFMEEGQVAARASGISAPSHFLGGGIDACDQRVIKYCLWSGVDTFHCQEAKKSSIPVISHSQDDELYFSWGTTDLLYRSSQTNIAADIQFSSQRLFS